MFQGSVIACLLLSHLAGESTARQTPAVELKFLVKDTQGKTMPCRIHLADKDNKPVRVPNQVYWNDHFVCDGSPTLELSPGTYHWTVERGPEFERKSGTIQLDQKKEIQVSLERISDLRSKGWIGGDMHVHRNPAHIQLLMQAEDLAFAPVITWWNRPADKTPPPAKTVFQFDRFRIYTTMAGEDERNGGALLFFGMDRPLDLTVKSKEYPSPMEFARQARDHDANVWIDIEKPFWWDMPVWIASGQMNSIGLANNHMCRSQMLASEAWGKPRNQKRLPSPKGNGYWTQEIYYHLLNSGVKIPPSAGSASGVLANPVGYNRVYVYCGEKFSRESWFTALKQGKAFVTNGPLIQASANSQLPGHKFQFEGSPKTISIELDLISNDFVPKLEVVFNGKVVKTIVCAKQLKQKKSFSFQADQPGWFLVRAIADVKPTFRFASTAPWYIESNDGKPSVSRSSSQFFLDWVNERIEQVRKNIESPDQRAEVVKHHLRALDFWKKKVESATRD